MATPDWFETIKARAEKDIQKITARLAELDAERKQLMKARDAYRSLIGKGVAELSAEQPKESLKDVIFNILVDAGRPMALRELEPAIVARGIPLEGKAPRMSIYAALNRNKDIFKNTKDKRWTVTTEYPTELNT